MREKITIKEQVRLFVIVMTAQEKAESTKRSYVSVLRKFLWYFKKHPKDITSHDITEWMTKHDAPATKAQVRGALLNYYKYVVGQYKVFDQVPVPKQAKKLPVIMAQEVVVQRINAIENIKHRAIVSVLYGAGLRRDELLNLRISDIDKFRETFHIHYGKGAKDRIVPVSKNLLILLREYSRLYKPKHYLFEGRKRRKYSPQSVLKVCWKYMKVNPHNLRHCHATHLVEAGVHISEVSKRLGHAKLETTMVYNHIATTHNPITLLAA